MGLAAFVGQTCEKVGSCQKTALPGFHLGLCRTQLSISGVLQTRTAANLGCPEVAKSHRTTMLKFGSLKKRAAGLHCIIMCKFMNKVQILMLKVVTDHFFRQISGL